MAAVNDIGIDLSLPDEERMAIAVKESLKTYGHEQQIREDEELARRLQASLDKIGLSEDLRPSSVCRRPVATVNPLPANNPINVRPFTPRPGSARPRSARPGSRPTPHVGARPRMPAITENERRIVLVGLTGSGKSSTGNTIIGRKVFEENCGGQSVTQTCCYATEKIDGRNITVVDTPGLYDVQTKNDITMAEIVKCLMLTAPGPHAIILVLRAERQTEVVQKSADFIMETFGEQACKFMTVLFTGADDLQYHGQSIDQYVRSLPDKMQRVVEACGNRRAVIDNHNRSADNSSQVKELLSQIDEMVRKNNGLYFTNPILKHFEQMLEGRDMEIRVALEKEKEDELCLAEKEMQSRLKEELDKRKRELEDEYNDKIARAREEIRNQVESDKKGTGSLIKEGLEGLKKMAKSLGKTVLKCTAKVALLLVFG